MSLPFSLLDTLYFFSGVLIFIFHKYRSGSARLLPPGPKGLPFIGNVFDLPQGLEGQHWAKHKDLYGRISSISLFGKTIIILNDRRLAVELLETRSNKYCDRPTYAFGGQLCGAELLVLLLQYSERFRKTRKYMHRFMGSRASMSHFETIFQVEARNLMMKLLKKPEIFREHIHLWSLDLLMKITYGYSTPNGEHNQLLDSFESVLTRFSASSQPHIGALDLLPFLKFLPDWLPGTTYKKSAKEWSWTISNFRDVFFEWARSRSLQEDSWIPFVSSHFNHSGLGAEAEDILKWTAVGMVGAGSDTMDSAFSTFILSLLLYPSVLQRAQAEIDFVTAGIRMPTLADRPCLPYITALVKEVLRWHVAAPLAAPHVALEDDTCDGFFIPKGSHIISNIWQHTHDPETYTDPHTFKPERFLKADGLNPELDPEKFVFGFGRRTCPGKELAMSALFSTIVTFIAVFEVRKDGKTFIEPAYTKGTVSHPENFRCIIQPRSLQSVALLTGI